MSKLELKSTFMTGMDSKRLVRKFLTKEMNVKIIHEWPYCECCGYSVIDIPQKDYERVLPEVQKYVVENNLPYVKWINQYNVALECGYVQLAYAILRRKRKGNVLWCANQYLPEDIYAYARKMEEALGVEVTQSYNETDRALCFASRSLDYKKQLELMKSFILQEGTGPFSRIMPVTYTGEVQKKESFTFLKIR